MRLFRLAALLVTAAAAHAEMSVDQKLLDFEQLASLYAKNYAPYEWKVQTQGHDLFDLRPWLDKVRQTSDDLSYLEVCVAYVAALNDAHDLFTIPSSFRATLPFTVDIYDGKVLIDSINRSRAPSSQYPFAIGDELVSVDGVTADEWITRFLPYATAANQRSTRRAAANLIASRSQSVYPRAHQIGDNASVVIRRAEGALETYEIAWLKTGTAITSIGPVPDLRLKARLASTDPDETPRYMRSLQRLQETAIPEERWAALGMGSQQPVFRLPANFQQRLGRSSGDPFVSGMFEAQGLKIGFIRIPHYSQSSAPPPYAPANTALPFALQSFQNEMVWMDANTDGLVIDDTRNPGGNACYVEGLLQRVMPYRFRAIGFQVRATATWIASLSSGLQSAKGNNAEQWVIDLYQSILDGVQSAYKENRGLTGPISICNVSLDLDPAKDAAGKVIAYSKPLMVLVDEFSASGGDMFPAAIQDNKRGIIFGMRTMGAGGSVVSYDATNFSEGLARVTVSLMNRKDPVTTTDLPAAPFVENIGVRPEVEYDYMTRDNLVNGGKAFVDAFTAAIVDHINKSRNVATEPFEPSYN